MFESRPARDVLYHPAGSDIPPAVYNPANPLLRPDDRKWETILTSIQDPAALFEDHAPLSTMVGELNQMCSSDEVIEKQQTCTASDLERLNQTSARDPDLRLVNPLLAVKSFQRSDASKVFLPSDIRPVLWCRRTVNAILNLHVEADCKALPWLYRKPEGYRFIDVYNFVRDRLRSVWTDLTVQHCLCHRGTIESLEVSFRFLLLSEELLCNQADFNAVQNGALISTCLDKLMASYTAVRQALAGSTDSRQQLESSSGLSETAKHLAIKERLALYDVIVYQSPYEAEFWAYRILLCMSHGPAEAPAAVLASRLKMPREFLTDLRVRRAIKALEAFTEGNAIKFFKLIEKGDILTGVLLNKFANLVRISLLSILSGSARTRQQSCLPYALFLHLFYFTDEPESVVETFCAANDIEINRDATASKSPVSVYFGNVNINWTDVRPKNLRCQRFPSTRLAALCTQSRRRLLDPDLPSGTTSINGDVHIDSGTKAFPTTRPPLTAPLTVQMSAKPELIERASTPRSQLASSAKANWVFLTPSSSRNQEKAVITNGRRATQRLSRPFGITSTIDLPDSPEAPPHRRKVQDPEPKQPPPQAPHFGTIPEDDSAATSEVEPLTSSPARPRVAKRKAEEVDILLNEGGPDGSPTRHEDGGVKKLRHTACSPLFASPIVPTEEDSSQQRAAVSTYRRRVALELCTLPQETLQSVQRLLEENALKVPQNLEALPVQKVLKSFVPEVSNALAELTPVKGIAWHCCFIDTSFAVPNCQTFIDALLFGADFPEGPLHRGALSTWSDDKLVSASTTSHGHLSQWVRSRRVSGRLSVFCESVKGCKSLKARSSTSPVMFWNLQKEICLSKCAPTSGKFKLEPGTHNTLTREIEMFEEALASVNSTPDGEYDSAAWVDVAFLVHLKIITTQEKNGVDEAESMRKKQGFLEKMSSGISMRLSALLKKRLMPGSHSTNSTSLSPSTRALYEKLVERYTETEKSFVFIVSLSSAYVTTSSQKPSPSNAGFSTKCMTDSPSSAQTAKVHFLVSGVNQALDYSTELAVTSLLSLCDQLVTEKNVKPIVRSIVRSPLQIIWPRRATEPLPYVLITLWKRAVEKIDAPKPTIQLLVNALVDGVRNFHQSYLWECCSTKLNVHVPDDVEESSSSTDSEIGGNEGKGRLTSPSMIKKMLRKVEKSLKQIINSPHTIQKMDKPDDPQGSTSPSKSADLLFRARHMVRQMVKTALENLTWKKEKGVLLKINLSLPYPLYLLASASELPPWKEKVLPRQFYDSWIDDKEEALESSKSPSECGGSRNKKLSKIKKVATTSSVVESSSTTASDIFEVFQLRLKQTTEKVSRECEADEKVVAHLKEQLTTTAPYI